MMLRLPLLLLFHCVKAAPSSPDHRSLVPASAHGKRAYLPSATRQSSPVNAALTGLFSPPFIVMVGMGALAHTFERFVTDMWRYTSQRNPIRRRKKKKKPPQEPIKPFPPYVSPFGPPPPPAPVAENPEDGETYDQETGAIETDAIETDAIDTSAPTRKKWRYR